MKKNIFIYILWLMPTCFLLAQVDNYPWSPQGATWLYRVTSQTSQSYVKLSYQKDTTYFGKNVKKFVVSKFDYIGIPPNLIRTKETFTSNEYMYNSSDSVFWYHDNGFQLLYVFSASIGSTWEVKKSSNFTCVNSGTPDSNPLTIRDVQQGTLAGRQFIILAANPQPYWTIGTLFIKNIGSRQTWFPIPGASACTLVDGNVGLPEVLTCYYDNLRGSIDFGNVGNCQGLISSTKSLGENTSLSIRIVPNPVVNTLHIATNALSNIKSFKIFDLIGHEYINVQNYDSQEINAGNLPSGMYIVVLKMSDNSYYSTKFAKIQ